MNGRLVFCLKLFYYVYLKSADVLFIYTFYFGLLIFCCQSVAMIHS